MADHVVTPAFDRLDLMLALAGINPEHVDAFVEHRMRGRYLDDIAIEEGVTANAIHLRVKTAERAIRRYLERRDHRARDTSRGDQLARAR